MTEQDWLTATDPLPMLEYLRANELARDRQFRLFACASVRRIWTHLPDERSRTAVEVAERFIDGQGSRDEVFAATVPAFEVLRMSDPASMAAFVASCGGLIIPALAAWGAAVAAAGSVAASERGRLMGVLHGYVARDIGSAWAEGDAGQERNWVGFISVREQIDGDPRRDQELAAQARLLRDIVGNPFRPLPILSPSLLTWRAGLVVPLAEGIYENRAFTPDRLAVRADALEEAGCNDAELLGHLRQPDVPHVRGCWAVDCLLGKT